MAPGKVVAYIVRDDALVAFLHENDRDPVFESGLQVPAATMHDGEEPAPLLVAAQGVFVSNVDAAP